MGRGSGTLQLPPMATLATSQKASYQLLLDEFHIASVNSIILIVVVIGGLHTEKIKSPGVAAPINPSYMYPWAQL